MKSFHADKFSLTNLRLPALSYIRAWKNSAGPILLKEIQFLGVHKSIKTKDSLVLRLGCAQSTWKQSLYFQKKEILKHFSQALTHLGVEASLHPSSLYVEMFFKKERK